MVKEFTLITYIEASNSSPLYYCRNVFAFYFQQLFFRPEYGARKVDLILVACNLPSMVQCKASDNIGET